MNAHFLLYQNPEYSFRLPHTMANYQIGHLSCFPVQKFPYMG